MHFLTTLLKGKISDFTKIHFDKFVLCVCRNLRILHMNVYTVSFSNLHNKNTRCKIISTSIICSLVYEQ